MAYWRFCFIFLETFIAKLMCVCFHNFCVGVFYQRIWQDITKYWINSRTCWLMVLTLKMKLTSPWWEDIFEQERGISTAEQLELIFILLLRGRGCVNELNCLHAKMERWHFRRMFKLPFFFFILLQINLLVPIDKFAIECQKNPRLFSFCFTSLCDWSRKLRATLLTKQMQN